MEADHLQPATKPRSRWKEARDLYSVVHLPTSPRPLGSHRGASAGRQAIRSRDLHAAESPGAPMGLPGLLGVGWKQDRQGRYVVAVSNRGPDSSSVAVGPALGRPTPRSGREGTPGLCSPRYVRASEYRGMATPIPGCRYGPSPPDAPGLGEGPVRREVADGPAFEDRVDRAPTVCRGEETRGPHTTVGARHAPIGREDRSTEGGPGGFYPRPTAVVRPRGLQGREGAPDDHTENLRARQHRHDHPVSGTQPRRHDGWDRRVRPRYGGGRVDGSGTGILRREPTCWYMS